MRLNLDATGQMKLPKSGRQRTVISSAGARRATRDAPPSRFAAHLHDDARSTLLETGAEPLLEPGEGSLRTAEDALLRAQALLRHASARSRGQSRRCRGPARAHRRREARHVDLRSPFGRGSAGTVEASLYAVSDAAPGSNSVAIGLRFRMSAGLAGLPNQSSPLFGSLARSTAHSSRRTCAS